MDLTRKTKLFEGCWCLFSSDLQFIWVYVNLRWLYFFLMYVSLSSVVMLFRYGTLVLVIYHCLILYGLISFFLFFLVWFRHVFNENIDQYVNQVGDDVSFFCTFIIITYDSSCYLFYIIFIYIFTYLFRFIFAYLNI